MKKILATTLAFVLLSTVFFVSKVPVRAAEGTTTGTFLSATRSIPERTNKVTYKTDNSNVSKTFGTALKITPGNPGLLFFAESNPISGGKGMLMYAKTEADDKTTTPMFYITGENNLNAEANKDGKWYILTENDKSWQEKTYSNYGCELEPGFDGYIYIPFSNYSKLDDTVKITGYNLYLLKGGSYENNNITLGQPIIVTSEGIPNAKSINCDGTEYVYFAVTTGTFLSATRSMPDPIFYFTAEVDNSDTLKTFGTAVKIISDAEQRGQFYFADNNPVGGGKGMLMYAKTMNDGIATRPQIYIIADTGVAYSYSGIWYTLNKNDEEWQELNYDQYGGELPSGFDGYIYIPFDAITQIPLQKTSKVKGYSVQLLRNGTYTDGDYITLGQPIIVTSEGIPNAEKIDCGDWVYYYFGKKAPQYNGMITEAVAMDYDLNFNASDPTIPFDKENEIYPISGNHYKKRVRPAIDSSGFKLGSAFKFTTLTYTNEQGSCALNDPIYIKVKKNDIAAHGMMLYVKTENNGKPYGIQVYINGKYQYSGSAYALKRGGSTWENVGFASQYGPVLESGFEGYVYFPFVGGFAELDNKPIYTYNLYLTAGNNSEGQAIYEEGRSIIVSKPVAITSDLGDNPPSPEMLKFGNETKSYFTESAPKVLGDANGDKTTDIRDLVRLKTVLAGLSEETENADVDNNGVIDSFDLVALRKILLGILG